ncbi:ABC transporter permease [Klugiella xanthotipulae]|uniref:Autoinducer 2 import system permease protein LsrD n=1 Tax=Klugiella xanthotipulae TaxID=244735 RepID=A0A543HGZ5_9MICO|nr:ABC transporter permease [Klugiella xanthotipulae]TQM57605.1 monosaccharide ABC transporter membrane protein (CUT2 family) [Klugiella xanthotipulae]
MTTIWASAKANSRTKTYADYAKPLWQRYILNTEAAVILGLLVVALVASVMVRNFASDITLYYLLRDVTAILLMALPMTLIILTGDIDLSVASILALSSVTFGILVQNGWPVPAAIVGTLLVGLVCGAINGFLVTVVGLPSLAVTIGTMAAFRGIAQGILGTKAVTSFPVEWTNLTSIKIPGTGIPVLTILVVVLILVFAVLMHFTAFGRGVYAIGLSTEAAAFSGINVERTKMILFLLSGVMASLAGIYLTLKTNTARAENGTGLELTVIAAVLLGGVSIFGGRGSMHGVIAGVLLIGTIESALRLANVTSDVSRIIVGTLLVVSVVSPSFLGWLRGKPKRPTSPGIETQAILTKS